MLTLIHFVNPWPSKNLKSDVPVNNIKQTAIYILKFYYEEDPATIKFNRAYARSVNQDGSYCIQDFDVGNLKSATYSSCYSASGIPTEFGSEKELTRIFKDSVRLNFRGRDTTVMVDTEKELKDITTLWFWKHMPKLNETTTVGGIRKNFITNHVDLVRTAHTYLGKEKISVLGKMTTCYKVKSVPLNGSKDVYDERWYDQQGMLVKEKHIVGTNGVRIGELSEIVSIGKMN